MNFTNWLLTGAIIIGGAACSSGWAAQNGASTYRAVYSREFAQKFNLPTEGIDDSLNSQYPYFDAQHSITNVGQPFCEAGVIVEKPHDIAELPTEHLGRPIIYTSATSIVKSANDKPTRIDSMEVGTLSFPKDGFRTSAAAYMISDIVTGYDYFYAVTPCSGLRDHKKDKDLALRFSKASVWGRTVMQHRHYDEPGTPHGEAFEKSFIKVRIPVQLYPLF